MTTKEMAEIIGISRITLSKYLNGKGGISQKSIDKIERCIKQYNFAPNTHARSLAGKQEQIISFVSTFSGVTDGVSRISSHFATLFTNYILVEAKKFGLKVLVTITDSQHAIGELEQLFSSSLIRGAVIFGLESGSEGFERINSRGYPVVLVNQEEQSPSPNISLVNMDDRKCAYDTVMRLVNEGHTRLMYIGSSLKRLPAQRRQRGVAHALNELQGQGISCILGNADFKEDLAYEYVHTYFSEHEEHPTAIIAANDLTAIGAINALKALRIKVPGQVSVIGFDDIAVSAYFSPPITTFRADYEMMAQQTIKELVALIDGDHAGTVIEIPMEMVERSSSQALR
jgi:LacI family transcriptional regulator